MCRYVKQQLRLKGSTPRTGSPTSNGNGNGDAHGTKGSDRKRE